MMNDYYLGGYYLVHLEPIDFGSQQGKLCYSCSACKNTSLLNMSTFGWLTNDSKYNYNRDLETKRLLQIDDPELEKIREWVNIKLDQDELDSSCIFNDLTTAKEYRDRFLSHLPSAQLMALYFDKISSDIVVDKCSGENYEFGEFGLRKNLLRQIRMTDSATEIEIGNDLIGITENGDFHSFHCHDAGNDLMERFGVTINKFNLLETKDSWDAVLNYANDSNLSGFTSVPWVITKTKLILS